MKKFLVGLGLIYRLVCLGQTQETPEPAKPPEGLSVEALVTEVLNNNPEIRFYEAEIAAAKGEGRNAATLPNPELTTSVGAKRAREGGRLAGEGVAWSVSLQQPFEWPGRLGLRKAIANHQIALAELGNEQFKSALAARVRVLALQLSSAQQQSAAARKVANRLDELNETVLQRDPAGVTPLLEQRILEANAMVFRRKASELAVSARSALIELNQLRGKSPTSKLVVSLPQFKFAEPASFGSLIGGALTHNFDIRLRVMELEQQGLKVDLARNEKNPGFVVGPFYSQEKAGEKETTFGLEFSAPLPLWNRNQGSIESARARENQARSSLSRAQRELERQIAEESLLYAEKMEEIGSWKENSIQRLEEAATLADEHYRLGAVPISTYVELQEKYLEAMETLSKTRLEAIESLLKLEQLTGIRLREPKEVK